MILVLRESLFLFKIITVSLTGIILSGGKSKRMGKDKGQCLINGKPLVKYAVDAVSGLCNPILISANIKDYQNYGYEIIPDIIEGIGPLGGIYSGLINSKTDMNIILSCDMPLIQRDLIAYILSKNDGYQAVVPLFGGFPEPLCALYSQSCIDHINGCIQSEVFKIQEVLKGLNTKFLPIEPPLGFYHKDLFANVNDKKELNRIEKLIKDFRIDEAR